MRNTAMPVNRSARFTFVLIFTLALAFLLASFAPAVSGGAAPARDTMNNPVPPPQDVTVTRYGDSYLVTWSAVECPGVAGYNVYRTHSDSPRLICFGRLNWRPITDTYFLDTTTCRKQRIQYYWVAAVNRRGIPLSLAGPVSIDPRVPDTTPPTPPTGLEAGALEVGVSLTWNLDNYEPDFAGFNIYVQKGGSGTEVRLNCTPLRDDFLYYEQGHAGDVFYVGGVDTCGNESAACTAVAVCLPEQVSELDAPGGMISGITYTGDWACEPAVGASGGQLYVSMDGGDTVEVEFYGRSVKLVSARYWQCGLCRVYLDGRNRGVVNLSADELEFGFVVFSDFSLRPGCHTIRLLNLGTPGCPDGWEYGIHFVNVDCLVVR